MSRQRVAVIAGAGPAGLTAAFELLERTDVKPIVLESTSAIGGIAQTYNYKGNRMDIGGHRFFSKSERVMSWWFSMLPRQGAPAPDQTDWDEDESDHGDGPDPEHEDEVMLHRPRLSRIYFRRHFFPYPIAVTLGVARRLGFVNTGLIGLSYLRARAFPRRDETYLDAFFINRFGRRLYETFFRDYTEKVWGVRCGEIRADWGAQRVKGLSLKRAVAHAIRDLLSSDFQKRQEERETSLITRFFYPKLGPGQMWERVARQVVARGGEVRLAQRVVGVTLDGSAAGGAGERVSSVEVEDTATGARTRLECDFFFSTMPVRELVAQVQPSPPAEVRRVASGLCYRDFLTVGLLLRELHVQVKGQRPARTVGDNWIYVQDGGVRIGRIQVFNNWSPYMVADPANTVWLGLEYFVTQDDDLWRMDDADLIALGTAELERIGFVRGADVLDGCVLRMPKAYPSYIGTYDELPVVRAWARGIPNLFMVGRNGMHRYNNQDHSMLTAMMAVDNIVEGRPDHDNLWDVNLDMVYHEEKSA